MERFVKLIDCFIELQNHEMDHDIHENDFIYYVSNETGLSERMKVLLPDYEFCVSRGYFCFNEDKCNEPCPQEVESITVNFTENNKIKQSHTFYDVNPKTVSDVVSSLYDIRGLFYHNRVINYKITNKILELNFIRIKSKRDQMLSDIFDGFFKSIK